ncbi:MAG: hypothetical protein GQ527_00940 [Bacteroidales bacterium]|nr:hypothetical protein [Bacteroidales bacterium]
MKTFLGKSILAILLLLALGLKAQFVTPISTISGTTEVTTLDGKKHQGELRSASFGPNGVMSFKLIDDAGNGVKYKANEIEQLKIKVDGLAKLEIIAEQSSNISKLSNSNFKEVVEREYIYWQRFKHPTKEKYYLLQLLNPGFDSKIKVYDIPGAKSAETSINDVAVSGNESNAFYVLKNGSSYKVSKKKYKKQDYRLLFSDCPKLMENEKPDFKFFAQDIFFYSEACE